MVGTLRYRTTVTLVTMSLETGFVSFYACSWLFQLVQLLNSWESNLELKRGNHVGIFIVLPFTFFKNLKLRHFKSQLSKDNKEIYRKAWKELFRTLGVRSFEIIQIRIQDHLDHGASNKPLHPILTRETDLCCGFVYPVGSKTYFEELGTRRIDMKIRPT